MAEGLFDGRYRYDFIYPRGRSGETLRAYDTEANDRPVVIKRPAPNDAPPIRGGQEVSILNERDALRRLTGHPVLTELLGEGHYLVGGTSHHYIVMERATGSIIEEEVLELAQRGERLPLLEVLVVVDQLLDLLDTAHRRKIIYNDVDAKHLFWQRDNHRLKVIDWGNAVHLDEETQPGTVNEQSDVYQTGELLYFILSGGGRADVPRDAPVAFTVSFGQDAQRLPSELVRVISIALHPNTNVRYRTIHELRRELEKVRRPLEEQRNQVLSRVNNQLRRTLSRDELHDLQRVLQPVQQADPGYPPVREALDEVANRLGDLQISADLDAARIYMQSANWESAADILGELRGRARGDMRQTARLLFDWCMLLLDDENLPTSQPMLDAITQVFEGQPATAARDLVRAETPDPMLHRIHLRLAERVTSHVPEVVLLRPNLFRLGEALANLDGTDGVHLGEQRELLDEINRMLDAPVRDAEDEPVSLIHLRDVYRGIVDRLTALTTLMEAVNIGWGERRLPLSSLERARNAAMALADNMHIIGKQAASTPREAMAALDNSRDIDPTNEAWGAVAELLNDLYRVLESCQTYVPVADGSDLSTWLKRTHSQLQPFTERLFDEMLTGMVQGLSSAGEQWEAYDSLTLAGNRVGTGLALSSASNSVSTLSPSLANWLNQLRTVVKNADYIERHALTGGLGRALADGWAAFDKGNLADAERLALQAEQVARTELHNFVVGRFKSIVEILRAWIERKGYLSAERTEAALEKVSGLYTDEENIVRERFNKQMPTRETYLKAMGKGLVETYALHSSAAQRVLFVDYVLQGAIDAQDNAFDDAGFWEEAASRALEPHAADHVGVKTLRDLVERRKGLLEVEAILNNAHGVGAIDTLGDVRKQLENHPQAKLLSEAIRSLREIEAALPEWANAEFRTAGMKLENAVKAVQETEKTTNVDFSTYRDWVSGLGATAAELHMVRRDLREVINTRPDQPTPELAAQHERMVNETERSVGAEYAATLMVWRDTYYAFVDVIKDQQVRRSAKLTAMNDLFRAMFIDRHPAYPLYRHWHDLIERAPEFPAPPTDEPQPRMADEDESLTADEAVPQDEMAPLPPEAAPRSRRSDGGVMTYVVGGLIVIAVLLAGWLVATSVFGFSLGGEGAAGTGATEEVTEEGVAVALAGTAEVTEDTAVGATEAVTVTDAPTDTVTAPPATATDADTATPNPSATATVTATLTETATETPSVTATVTATPTPALPAGGLTGEVDALAVLERLPVENAGAVFWDAERVAIEAGHWRVGTGSTTPQEVYVFAPPQAVVEAYFGGSADERMLVAETEIVLVTFNPDLLGNDSVYFGAVLAPAASADGLAGGAGMHIEVVQPGVLNVGTRQDNTVTTVIQRSVGAVIVRVRLERLPDGTVQARLNGEPIGGPMRPTGSESVDSPVVPAIYVKDGGVVLHITEWTWTLQ